MSEKQETFQQDIEAVLTESELAARRVTLEHATQEWLRLEERKKDESKVLSDAVKAKKKEITKLCEVLKSGKEMQTIECFQQRDEQRQQVNIVRVDTGEILSERPFTYEERQGSLFEDEEESDSEPDAAAQPEGEAAEPH